MAAKVKKSKPKPTIVHRPDGDYQVFTLPTEILQFSERKITNRLMELHSLQLKGRIDADEAKRLGRIALEEQYKENLKLFNRSAVSQGFKEAPIQLMNRKNVDEQIRKWEDAVDRTAKLQPDGKPRVPPPPG